MRVALRNLSVFLIAVFAVFYCGNTVFIHSHLYQGHRITHSHPYLPGGEHGHNALELELIALNNNVAASIITSSDIDVPELHAVLLEVLESGVTLVLEHVDIVFFTVRGPPSSAFNA